MILQNAMWPALFLFLSVCLCLFIKDLLRFTKVTCVVKNAACFVYDDDNMYPCYNFWHMC